MKKIILFLFAAYFSVSPVYFAQENKDASQEVDGFTLSQYEEGGGKKWELNGEQAEVEDKKVKIDEISAVAFGKDTTLKLKARQGDFDKAGNLVHLQNDVVVKSTDGTTLKTDSLYWDAGSKNVFTDESVNIKKSEFEVNGTGAVCDMEQKTVELKKDITANINTAAPDYLGTRDKGQETIITCDGPLEINYKKNKATFLGNVKVEDIEGSISSDRMDVYFSKDTRKIKCVVARGNVKILNGGNITYSEKAIYLVDEGRVILPQRPKLVIDTGPREEIK